jgi:hypothetical protein
LKSSVARTANRTVGTVQIDRYFMLLLLLRNRTASATTTEETEQLRGGESARKALRSATTVEGRGATW